jgi:hypothetical protein
MSRDDALVEEPGSSLHPDLGALADDHIRNLVPTEPVCIEN